jgi:hypothetical protein
MAGRRRTRRLPTTGDLFGIKVAAAPAEAGYNLDAVAGRPTHAPLKGSRLSSANGQALDRRWTIIGLFISALLRGSATGRDPQAPSTLWITIIRQH